MISSEPWYTQKTALLDLGQLKAQAALLSKAGTPNPIQIAKLWEQEQDLSPEVSWSEREADAMDYVAHTLAPAYMTVLEAHNRSTISPDLQVLQDAMTAYHAQDYAEIVHRFLEKRDLRGKDVDLFTEIRDFMSHGGERVNDAVERHVLSDKEISSLQQEVHRVWALADKCLNYPSAYNKAEWARAYREWETFWVPMMERGA